MKTRILSIAVVTALALISCKNEAKHNNSEEATEVSVETTETSEDMAMTEITFGVRGNCGMCKKTIEKAANSVDGVGMASWDKARKKIDVKFDGSKTDVMAIHKAIAASGYDTEKLNANEEAYSNLPECCQYDHDMMMNQSGEMMDKNAHEQHDH
jgi:copper chaperone CopZ